MEVATINSNKRVGVVGLGSVGKAVLKGLEYFYDCVGYDIVGEYSWSKILDSDAVFICVPTPEGFNGRLDCSKIDAVLDRLSQKSYSGLVVIKSTLRIGYMEEANKEFGSLRLVYMPEFLRERSSFVWFVNPDRLVISGNDNDVEEALSYFQWVEGAKVLRMDYRSAEIGKLAHNSFIATKVSFTNEMERICGELGGNPKAVMDIVAADRRIKSKEHLRPFLGAYGGKCVPKDTRELLNASTQTVLLEAVEVVNEDAKASEASGDD